MRITLLLAPCIIFLAGCSSTRVPATATTQPVADAGFQVDPVELGPNQTLWAALFAFREGRGAWPATPEELCPSSYMQATVGLPYYTGLQFTPLPDGRLDVSYRQLRSPKTGVVAGTYHTILTYPADRWPTGVSSEYGKFTKFVVNVGLDGTLWSEGIMLNGDADLAAFAKEIGDASDALIVLSPQNSPTFGTLVAARHRLSAAGFPHVVIQGLSDGSVADSRSP